MPDETYRLIYEGVDRAGRVIDGLIAKMGLLDKAVEKTNARLKTLGADRTEITKLIGALVKLDGELKSKVVDAAAADKALKGVGSGNRGVAAMTKRLKELEAQLQGVTAAAGAAGPATAAVGKGAAGPGRGGAVGGGGRSVVNAAIQTGVNFTFGLARRGVGAAGGAIAAQRDYFAAAAEQTGDFRKALSQYASLRKHAGPDDQIVKEAARFGRETGVAPDDIVPFLETYEGTAAGGRDKGNVGGVVGKDGFTKDQQEALESSIKVFGGQFAIRTGLDAKTAGDLTGIVGNFRKINSVKDVAGQIGGMHYGLDAGRGDISPLARGELAQAGSEIESKRVAGLPELGAWVGVTSMVSKSASGAGTSYGQISRLLNESAKKKGKFLEEIGVAGKQGNFAKLKALRDHLREAQAAQPDLDANKYLVGKGFGNSTDVRSTLSMIGNVDLLETRINEAERVAANPDETLALNAANQRTSRATTARNEAVGFSREIETGLIAGPLATGRAEAINRLKDPNLPGGQRLKTDAFGGVGDWFSSMLSGGSRTGEEIRVDIEAFNALAERGRKVNIDVAKRHPELMAHKSPLLSSALPEQQVATEYAAAASEVEAAERDAAAKLEAAAALLKGAAKDMKRDGAAGAPPGGGPGGGFVPGRR